MLSDYSGHIEILVFDAILAFLIMWLAFTFLIIWATMPREIRKLRGSKITRIAWGAIMLWNMIVGWLSAHASVRLIRGAYVPIEWSLVLRTLALFSILSMLLLLSAVLARDYFLSKETCYFIKAIEAEINHSLHAKVEENEEELETMKG